MPAEGDGSVPVKIFGEPSIRLDFREATACKLSLV